MPSSRAVILPYKLGSRSAKNLAEGLSRALNLKVRRVRSDGRYRPKARSLVINYGSNTSPGWWPVNRVNTLNPPTACSIAGNKVRAFQAFQQHGVMTPEWTTDQALANRWASEGHTVVSRTILNGHSGRGIVLTPPNGQVPFAPLYVKYKKKKKEFRVHVFRGQVIDVSEKRRVRREARLEAFDGYIRNHSNGWVFCRDGLVVPEDAGAKAIAACAACDLDFGAVDIIWNERDNCSYVLEVNTAPGLEGTTLQRYTTAVLNWIRGA